MTRLPATAIAAIALSTSVLAGAGGAEAQAILGTADYYAILAGSTITNTGPSVINGDIGLSPGTAIVGFPPGVLATGTEHKTDGPAALAQSDLTIGYNTLVGSPTTADLTGVDLGGRTLSAGVYSFTAAAQLTGTLTLNGQGNPNAVFIIQVGSAFTTASNSAVVLINGAQSGNVYFVVGSSATLGTATQFNGKIVALTSITLNTGANITCGAALARNGAVTLDTNNITVCPLVAATVTDVVTGTGGGGTGTGGTTPVVTETAAVLDAYIAAHGALPPGFQNLVAFLPADQLAAALAQLAGQTATGVAPSGMQGMDSFLSQMFDAAFADEQGGPQPAPNRPPGTVKALGYADEKQPTAVDAAYFALNANPTRRSVWASAYGTRGTTVGDVSVGSSDRFASTFGVAAGYDYRVAPDVKVGVSFGVGRTNYDITDGLGGGSSDMLQVAIYGKKDVGAAYLAGALAYGYDRVSTNRVAPLATTDSFNAEFNAHDFAAQAETGIHFGWFTPYAAVRAQAFYTPAYQETSSTGAGADFALAYEDSTTYSARTELGVRLAKSFAIHNGKTLGLNGRVAWAHDFSSAPSVVADFQSLPGSPFTITGAGEARDSILVSAGADLMFINGFVIGGTFDGAFSEGAQRYGGKARVRLIW